MTKMMMEKICFLVVVSLLAGAALRATLLEAEDKMGKCDACHHGKNILMEVRSPDLHFKHFSSGSFSGDCSSCHTGAGSGDTKDAIDTHVQEVRLSKDQTDRLLPYFRLLAEPDLLATKHGQMRVFCSDCHGSLSAPKEVLTDQCLKCHKSYEQLTMKANIHVSHVGKHPCEKCHHLHKPSQLMCNDCHEFEHIKVP